MIPLAAPHIAGKEWDYVKTCLDSGWVSSAGSFVSRFEDEVGSWLGGINAVAVSSGTAALHLALIASGVGRDDAVLVSDLTFIAPVNAIRYVGAHPVLIDPEPDHWQMDTALVRRYLHENCVTQDGHLIDQRTKHVVKAILPVHVLGHPVDINPLTELAGEFGLAVVEDASEALGATYRGRPAGTLGDIGCLSFNGNKVITTGGGGMVVARSDEVSHRCRYLSTQAKDDPVEYVHGDVGFNYRLTNVQGAIGCAQLESIESFLTAKRAIARRYAEALADVDGVQMMREAPWARSSWWLSTILVDEARTGIGSRDVIARLKEAEIEARPLWRPAHLNDPYLEDRFVGGGVSERLHRDAVCLPSSVGLDSGDQDRVIEVLLRTLA